MEEIGKLPTSQSSFHDHPHAQESHPLEVPPTQLQMEMNDDALDHHEVVGVGEGYQGGLDDQVTGLLYPIPKVYSSLPYRTVTVLSVITSAIYSVRTSCELSSPPLHPPPPIQQTS